MKIRHIIAAAAVPAAIIASLLGTAAPAAHAQTLPPPHSNGVVVKQTGKNAFVYDDYYLGWVKVNETSHPNFETISGTFLSGLPAWAYPGEDISGPWFSDFTIGPHAGQMGTLHGTINAAGTGYSGIVTYGS